MRRLQYIPAMASLDEDCSFQGPVIEKRDFHHPYTPYTIQETFMQTVYQVLEDSKIGILESPTGTVSQDQDGVNHVMSSDTLLMNM